MADKSAIQWCDATWNPLVGCSRVSEGCRHCYAERETYRLGERLEQPKFRGLTRLVGGEPQWTGEVRLWEPAHEQPLRWTKPRRVFVNSMSDLFHEKVRNEWIDRIFAVMAQSPTHTFQVLTKRPERMRAYFAIDRDELIDRIDDAAGSFGACHANIARWPLPNVWLGVSVEDQATADARIPLLLQTPAAVRWVSYEPALGSVDFVRGGFSFLDRLKSPTGKRHEKLDWLVVGGESGPGARPFDLAWARQAVAQGEARGVPVFVKQLGAHPVVEGRPWGQASRKGDDPTEWPPDLRVQEYPRGAR